MRYYNLEGYLFSDVGPHFRSEGSLGAFDFFSIVIWKANRAKSKVAKRLREHAPEDSTDLESVVRGLTRALFLAPTPRERLQLLLKTWGFRLPMATAILTVLWPDDFTVYDVRACEQLDDFERLANLTEFDAVWEGYVGFRDAVRASGPSGRSLRDCDRALWGRSAAGQLERDIANGFLRETATENDVP